ncbi:unnamed protein product [Pleuronectes platessa]|uniref:Uncharacterized protein n=1 Tax=Pleuronectes platessa TaxID=8262 RepID=A0A9N7TWM9_PLEPL|nr:unnamed protein product [Pleuronectes platessa]
MATADVEFSQVAATSVSPTEIGDEECCGAFFELSSASLIDRSLGKVNEQSGGEEKATLPAKSQLVRVCPCPKSSNVAKIKQEGIGDASAVSLYIIYGTCADTGWTLLDVLMGDRDWMRNRL